MTCPHGGRLLGGDGVGGELLGARRPWRDRGHACDGTSRALLLVGSRSRDRCGGAAVVHPPSSARCRPWWIRGRGQHSRGPRDAAQRRRWRAAADVGGVRSGRRREARRPIAERSAAAEKGKRGGPTSEEKGRGAPRFHINEERDVF
jgi:hypothetical protein